MGNGQIDRRAFLGAGAAGCAGLILGTTRAWASDTKPGAIVETSYGRIRGLVIDKVNAFKGIRYGAPTSGANRFMPAVKPAAWTGVKEAMEWGEEAPQGPHTEIAEVATTIPKLSVGEDCLALNVWTNSFSGKRPVMVWLHGGGFASGNGCYTMYDGANLARKRDVVTVTINHRLNAFGYMYYFRWQSPVSGGKLKSFHTLEIPFVMENVDEARGMTGEGKDRYALQDKISAAWTNFARTGNPSHKGLPNWPAFDTTKRATMLLNNDSRVANDPNGEERRLVASLRRA